MVRKQRIPALVSGGIILSYRCTSACRHCLYNCSPGQPDEWLTLARARAIFARLQAEPHLQDIHLAGGEPTLRMDLLESVIRLACEMGLSLSYVETNGGWCRDRETAMAGMRRLRDAGLSAVLISASVFHNEFIPFSATRHAVAAAHAVFGRAGTIVYLPNHYEALSRMPDDGTHRLRAFMEWAGLAGNPAALRRMFGLIPGGRVTTGLRECYESRPAASFAGAGCDELFDTSHFHIDLHGNLFTGHCPGIVTATVDRELHADLTPATHPVFTTLAGEGPCGLLAQAEAAGYRPRADGYISKCHLCIEVRRYLCRLGGYPELAPPSFYGAEASDPL